MPARIEAVGVATPRPMQRARAVSLSVRAARRALRRAGRRAHEADVLVYAGVYKDGHVAEPALAAFIQRRLAMNPSLARRPERSTFSFDLACGGTSLVSALEVASGLVDSGASACAVVVAADAAPDPGAGVRFPFHAAGAAVVVGRGEPDEGLVGFRFATHPEAADQLVARVAWDPRARGVRPWRRGRNVLQVVEKRDFEGTAIESAAAAAQALAAEHGLAPEDVDLWIPSTHPSGFPAGLAARLGLDPSRVVGAQEPPRPGLTAAVGLGLARCARGGRLARARHTMLVTVGAGLIVAVALLRDPSAAG